MGSSSSKPKVRSQQSASEESVNAALGTPLAPTTAASEALTAPETPAAPEAPSTVQAKPGPPAPRPRIPDDRVNSDNPREHFVRIQLLSHDKASQENRATNPPTPPGTPHFPRQHLSRSSRPGMGCSPEGCRWGPPRGGRGDREHHGPGRQPQETLRRLGDRSRESRDRREEHHAVWVPIQLPGQLDHSIWNTPIDPNRWTRVLPRKAANGAVGEVVG